jgi:ribosomal protein L11 methyltransferase
MKEAVFLQVKVEVIQEARLAVLDFLAELSPAGIVEESEWEGMRGPACVYLGREGSKEKLGLLERYLDSLRELWGDGAVLSYEVSELADPGWATEYRHFFKAQRVSSRITVSPPWEKYTAHKGEIVISIVPGPAFGTGTHETTRLCLSAIEEICADRQIRSMLDVGCGSAILSIAGALLGVDSVRGIESDPDAVSSARENVQRNGLEDRVTIHQETFVRSTGAFDLVVANLTTREIQPIIVSLLESVAPGGTLILSGILDVEEEKMWGILRGHVPSDWSGLSIRRLGEWLCIVVGRE